MVNWVADDVFLCTLITGKLEVKYVALNEVSDYYGMYSCITIPLVLFSFSYFYFSLNTVFSLVLVLLQQKLASVLVWNEERLCALEHVHTESYLF